MKRHLSRVLTPDVAIAAWAFLFTVAHSLPNLTVNPPLSYDEGYIIQAPWNLVLDGFYGTADGLDPWLFDPHLTTGPTVTIPVAAVFAAAGAGTAEARAVTVVYAGLATAAFYLLLRLASGRFVAALGALLLALSLYPYNRVLLGEAAALFWLFVGARLWLGRHRAMSVQLLAGLAFGLAGLTKLALAPIALGAVAGHWALVRFTSGPEEEGRRVSTLLVTIAAALAPLAAWYGTQVLLMGPAETLDRIFVIGDYRMQVIDPSPERLMKNLAGLVDTVPFGLRFWAVPAVLLAVMMTVRGAGRPVTSFLLLVTLLGGLYYLFSVGWPRYGFWVVVGLTGLIALLAQQFFAHGAILTGSRGPRPEHGEAGGGRVSSQRVRAGWKACPTGFPAALLGARGQQALVLVAFLAAPIAWNVNLLNAPEDHLGNVAAFLQPRLGPQEKLGTVEWELDFMAGRRFIHPPTYVATAQPALMGSAVERTWRKVDWVVTGPMGGFLGGEERLGAAGPFTEVFRSGPYGVFRRHRGGLPGWFWDSAGATRTPLLTTPAGQVFRAGSSTLDEIRVLLAADGARNSAPVYLRLYRGPSAEAPFFARGLPGREISENRWYSFPMEMLQVTPGHDYYFDLVSFPGPNQRAPTAWYNVSADHYPFGEMRVEGQPEAGDLYFGVIEYSP